MISIEGTLRCKSTNSKETLTVDQVYPVLEQISKDAIYGSFGNFPDSFLKDAVEKPLESLVKYQLDQSETEDLFEFTLHITEDLFKIKPAGLQHLIGVLAGDLFNLSWPSLAILDVNIKEVILPDSMQQDALSAFRKDTAYTIDEIRQAFKLVDGQPLLAFSFKPRTGIKFNVLKEVTLETLRAGFHLVELDTRNLNLQEDEIKQLLELAKQASQVGVNHITRFSPNLSIPSHLVTEVAARFLDVQADPVVIKIDGGLDGISSCQAIRGAFSKISGQTGYRITGRSPIITCYPLLRRQLKNRVSDNFFLDALSFSGADIIYPGGRPAFKSGGRDLDAADAGKINNAVRSYHRIIERGWPMPTVAGGIHAGQLHVFYELLGPNCAFFLGGGVALHKDGPQEGAKLCVKVINKAIELRQQAGRSALVENLNASLIREVEAAYPNKEFVYISPKSYLAHIQGWFIK